MTNSFTFEGFVLDTKERRLLAEGRPVELNGRYLDALALLVNEPGKLVSKDRFLDEVWKGVPVTDEALTQCIRTLRRTLGDDAGKPRFIETVPKHGYRFIASVQSLDQGRTPLLENDSERWREFVILGSAGTLGGAAAGAIGGLIYGFASSASGVGAISALLVLLFVTLLVAALGGAGVSFAIASTAFAQVRSWQLVTLAGAAGGLFVGAFGKLLGLDAFTLLVGRAPSGITGAMEGLLVGAGVGLGSWFAFRNGSVRRGSALAGLTGAAAGLIVSLLGGRLMLGSLELVAETFRART
ncbi:MAG TPA: transcriptional regulator [Sphingomicrobium sp.]|nr:transcriptional regulator [Sphingomicrobium sp.]